MEKAESLEFEQIKQKALKQLRSGEWLHGKDGAFALLFKISPDAAVGAGPESHSSHAKHNSEKRKNGKNKKGANGTTHGSI